ncbi:MAG: EAL domain-containing protein, partial [Nitrospirales bacterium]|nr:EAL domain-containing protein [Nitrospirales bacterium]
TLPLSASIGISIYPDDGENRESLLKNADIAMYHAKGQGGNKYRFYNPAMNAGTLERVLLENSLHQALGRGELMVHYQPQIDIETRRMIGAEALVRWRHPELGVLDPSRFLSLAEETGSILSIGEWVLKEACAQGKMWQEKGFPPLRITVNFSARQFQQPDFVEEVFRTLQETGLDPRFLDLEITESVAMRNIDYTLHTLQRLKERGVHFAIDDFGTGYSSFRHLKKLPVNKIKIDRSLIKGLVSDPDDKAVVNAVIAMAHNMKKRVLAEGVETEGQLRYLRTRHCDEIQGYLVSRPLPADNFENLLRTYAASSGSPPLTESG